MKKTLLMSLVFGMFIMTQIYAQAQQSVKSGIEDSFLQHFSGASDMRWSQRPMVSVVKFEQDKCQNVAFFSSDGTLLAHAKRTYASGPLPMAVQASIQRYGAIQEKAAGTVKWGPGYELLQAGTTRYLFPLENGIHQMFICVYSDGTLVRLKKSKIQSVPSEASATESILARQIRK